MLATILQTLSYQPPQPPNLFLIVGDDMGWANAGWHNNRTLTPKMDALVADGVELDRHYVFFYCSPSRSSLLTGRMPIHVTENNGYACTPTGPVPVEMTMLPAKLKTVGYTTVQIGKWHLGQHHPGQLPINRGFDHHFGYLGGAEDHYTNENGGCGECGKKTDLWRDRGPATGEAGGEFAAYKYDREALRVISTHDGATPLFMYYALQCAHAPNEPDAYYALYADRTEEFANYNGMISAVDSAVGNVTDALKANGMWENSLIVFTSDNGGPSAKTVSGAAANNWPLRGGKHTAWDGGHRVLAFVNGGLLPDAARGRKLDGYIASADWYRTLLGLAGVDATDAPPGLPDASDSLDVWPYVSGAAAASPRTEIALASRWADPPKNSPPGTNGSAALIVGDYKLVRFTQQYCFTTGPLYPNASTNHSSEPGGCDCGHLGCLYHIRNDPSESDDLRLSHPAVAARMLRRAEELDATAIEARKGVGWRGENNATRYCEAADARWGGFWGPDL